MFDRRTTGKLAAILATAVAAPATPAWADDEITSSPPAEATPVTAAPAAAAAATPAFDASKPLACQAPDEVAPGQKITVRCRVQPGLGAATVVILYRVPGSEDYVAVPTLRAKGGIYEGALHTSDIAAKRFQYYVEARDDNDEPVATSGDEESPHLMFIRAPAASPVSAAAGGAATARTAVADEPFLRMMATPPERPAGTNWRVRASKSVFVGLGVGAGYGWHPERRLEFRRDLKVDPGSGFAGLPHVTPEIGYQLRTNLSLSLQGRYQFIGTDGWGDPHPGDPARRAWAVMARACYYRGIGRLRGFASASLGLGTGFRVDVPPVPGSNLRRNDTVDGGPIVLGPGLGAIFHITQGIAAVAELRALAGAPGLAATADASAGLQVGF